MRSDLPGVCASVWRPGELGVGLRAFGEHCWWTRAGCKASTVMIGPYQAQHSYPASTGSTVQMQDPMWLSSFTVDSFCSLQVTTRMGQLWGLAASTASAFLSP